MPALARSTLLIVAILVGTVVALLGGGFSRAVEPEDYSASTSAYWLVVGAVCAAPFWVPALVPGRYSRAVKICRRVGAAALLPPTYMFAGIVVHNVDRILSGLGATPSAMFLGGALAIACAGCFVLLLRPDISAHAKRAT